jgi:hypothetical protein
MRLGQRTWKPLVALVLMLAACGGDADVGENPKAALDTALDSFSEYEGVEMGLTIESSPESLVALSEGDLTDEQAQQILDSAIAVTSKQNAEDPEKGQFEMAMNIAGTEDAVELRALGYDVYTRADVRGLVETFGGNPSELDAFESQAGGQPGFEFVGPLLDGEWIGLKNADQIVEQLTGQSIEEQTGEQAALSKQFADAFKDTSNVAAGDQEGPGDHVRVTVPVRDLWERFTKLAGDQMTALTQGQPIPDASELPDEDLVVDMWIEDEKLTQAELDIAQFSQWEGAEDMPEDVEDLRLRVTFEEFTGEIEAPEDFTEVDTATLIQGFLGGMGSSGSSTSSGNAVPTDG